jgi:acetyl esterase
MTTISWSPVRESRSTAADRRQRLALLAATRLPRSLSLRLAPREVPQEVRAIDRAALGLAAVSARAGLRMVIDGSARASREALTAGSGPLRGRSLPVEARETSIEGPSGPLAVRLYRPAARSQSLLVFAHGGGWAIGDLDVYDYTCRFLAHHSGVSILAVDYRLAPEHPFPAGIEDVTTAFRWAVEHAAELGVRPDRIAVGGDSAGATISAVVSADLVGEEARPAFQLLLYPATDLARRTPSRDRLGTGLLLTEPDIEWFYRSYAAGTDLADPRLSPLYRRADPRLPATYVATAGYDPLRDEGDAFAERLVAAGVRVHHDRQPDVVHGYLVFASLGGGLRRAGIDAARALREGLRGGWVRNREATHGAKT